MDRAEFMNRLTALLGDVPPAEREEAIQYYNDYFDDAGEGNEQGVIASLGSPEELARSIKAGLFGGENAGEFTESGFWGYEERRKNEVMQRPEEGAGGQNDRAQNQFNGSYRGQTDTYGRPNNRENCSGQQAGNDHPPKKPMSGGMIALIVILAVITSPAWIGFLGGLFGVSIGLLAGLFGIIMAFLIVGAVLTVAGIAFIAAGIAAMFAAPLDGMCMIGAGLILFAVGLVFVWLMVLVVGTVMPALVRGIVNLCRKLFYRGGVRA